MHVLPMMFAHFHGSICFACSKKRCNYLQLHFYFVRYNFSVCFSSGDFKQFCIYFLVVFISDLKPSLVCTVSAGVFVLLQVYAFLQYLKDRLTRQEFQTLFFLGVSLAAGVVFLSVIYLTYTGWLSIRRLVVYLTMCSKDG